MSPGYSIPYMWNYVLHIYIYTKSTIELTSVGLPQTCPMLLTIIVGFHQLLLLAQDKMKDFIQEQIHLARELASRYSFLSRDHFSRSHEINSHDLVRVDLMRVDLMAIDFVRIDLVTPSPRYSATYLQHQHRVFTENFFAQLGQGMSACLILQLEI